MNTRARVLLLLALAASPGSTPSEPARAQSYPTARQTELDRQVREVSSQLRCVVCQGVSIQDSPSSLAQEMRGVVREQLEAGSTPEQVRAYFVDRYGEWVLLRPKAEGFNLLIYLLPIAAILGGALFAFSKARSWTRAAPGAGTQERRSSESVTP
ncbi:MAG: cytochrome c-type biogenesis protein [Longimicrobiales bacterium]